MDPLQIHGPATITKIQMSSSLNIDEIPTTLSPLSELAKAEPKETPLMKRVQTNPLKALVHDPRLINPSILTLPLFQ